MMTRIYTLQACHEGVWADVAGKATLAQIKAAHAAWAQAQAARSFRVKLREYEDGRLIRDSIIA